MIALCIDYATFQFDWMEEISVIHEPWELHCPLKLNSGPAQFSSFQLAEYERALSFMFPLLRD